MNNIETFRKNKEINISEVNQRKIKLESYPLRLGLIVTNMCDLHCIMCPADRHRGQLTLSEDSLDKIRELLPYLERIEWQGGEFFNMLHIKSFFYKLRAYPNITHNITTNGLLLDEEWVELLLSLNAELTFSIDSTKKDIYEYIRKGGRYDRLIQNLRLISEKEQEHKRQLCRSITVVVMKANYLDLFDFVDFSKRYNFSTLSFNPVMFIEGEENIFENKDFNIEYLTATMHRIKDECRKSNLRVSWKLPYSAASEEDREKTAFQHPRLSNVYCNFPWKSIWVCADRGGGIYPDCWCLKSIGNIFQDTLLDAWNSETMQEYRRKILLNDSVICNAGCINSYTSTVSAKYY